jgi:hypothetical protein
MLKDMKSQLYGDDDAVQEAVRSWIRGTGTDLYRNVIFKARVALAEMRGSFYRVCREEAEHVQSVFFHAHLFHSTINVHMTLARCMYTHFLDEILKSAKRPTIL